MLSSVHYAIHLAPPRGFMVVEWLLEAGERGPHSIPMSASFDSLAAARAALPAGLHRHARAEDDVTSLVESWS